MPPWISSTSFNSERSWHHNLTEFFCYFFTFWVINTFENHVKEIYFRQEKFQTYFKQFNKQRYINLFQTRKSSKLTNQQVMLYKCAFDDTRQTWWKPSLDENNFACVKIIIKSTLKSVFTIWMYAYKKQEQEQKIYW